MAGMVGRGTVTRDGVARGTADAIGTVTAVGAVDIQRGGMKVDMPAATSGAEYMADSMRRQLRTVVDSTQRPPFMAVGASMAEVDSTEAAVSTAGVGK